MLPLPSGGSLRAVLARARCAKLWAGARGASGGPGCSPDAAAAAAAAGLLRGELDRFGGVSLRLERLDSLDAASFQRGLQGKCAWAQGLLGL